MLDHLVKSEFNSVRNCHAASQSDHTALHPAMQESFFSPTPSPVSGVLRVLGLTTLIGVWQHLTVVLIGESLMTQDTEHFLRCLSHKCFFPHGPNADISSSKQKELAYGDKGNMFLDWLG